jgi:hypothetical protein
MGLTLKSENVGALDEPELDEPELDEPELDEPDEPELAPALEAAELDNRVPLRLQNTSNLRSTC